LELCALDEHCDGFCTRIAMTAPAFVTPAGAFNPVFLQLQATSQ
jgi:hypothetical protein